MKYKVAIFLVLVSFYSFSQTYRFTYEMEYKIDSLSNDYRKEKMILDINDNQVQFYEFTAIETDSINRSGTGFSIYSSDIAKLRRSLNSPVNQNYYDINNNYFYFQTNDKIKWKIYPETKKKEDWIVQKATTDFGGRKWEAWFTQDLPFNEGPYKFNGLPGLIVEIRDAKGHYIFSLLKVEKNPKSYNPDIVEKVFARKPIKITKKKFKEISLDYYNDPFSTFRNMEEGSWFLMVRDEKISTKEGLNKLKRETQEYLRKNNNVIELSEAIKYK